MTTIQGSKLPGLQRRLAKADLSAIVGVAHLVQKEGVSPLQHASLRSIQRATSMTETTFYRHFDSRELMIRRCYDTAWSVVNEVLMCATFTDAESGAAAIQRDFECLVEVFFGDDADLCALATCAFYMFRRRAELHLPAGATVESDRLEARVTAFCRQAGADEPELLAHELLMLLISYWIIWNMNRDEPRLCDPAAFRADLADQLEALGFVNR